LQQQRWCHPNTGLSIACIFRSGWTQQRLQPLVNFGTKTPRDLSLEALVVRMDRGSNNPIDAVRGGRFEEKRPAPAFKLLRKLLRVRAGGGGLPLQPLGQRFAISDIRLPKTQQLANFSAVPFDAAAGQGQSEIGGAREPQFRSDLVDQCAFDFSWPPGKTATLAKECQEDGKAQSIGVVLRQDERMIVRGQSGHGGFFQSEEIHS
jgi:hypothetical protein